MIRLLVSMHCCWSGCRCRWPPTEGAVGRGHEASRNNLILEIADGYEASTIRDKKIKRIHKVQRSIADRYATAGSCAFFRITCKCA